MAIGASRLRSKQIKAPQFLIGERVRVTGGRTDRSVSRSRDGFERSQGHRQADPPKPASRRRSARSRPSSRIGTQARQHRIQIGVGHLLGDRQRRQRLGRQRRGATIPGQMPPRGCIVQRRRICVARGETHVPSPSTSRCSSRAGRHGMSNRRDRSRRTAPYRGTDARRARYEFAHRRTAATAGSACPVRRSRHRRRARVRAIRLQGAHRPAAASAAAGLAARRSPRISRRPLSARS